MLLPHTSPPSVLPLTDLSQLRTGKATGERQSVEGHEMLTESWGWDGDMTTLSEQNITL